MTSTKRSIVIGATIALVLVAVAVGLFLRNTKANDVPLAKVVVVFALPGEDDAVTAQLVATVDAATGRHELAEASSTVVVPGTSYTTLRDAYPFGGAEGVAAALAGGTIAADTKWVEVSPAAWKRLLGAGFDTTITEEFQAFDETLERYSEFERGPQHVAVEDLRGFVLGLEYLGAKARTGGAEDLASASLRALAAAKPGAGIGTDLTTGQWNALVQAVGRNNN